MDFENQFPDWEKDGSEPSEDLKKTGFQGGYKPPASVFNWFWSKVMKAIKEIQTKISGEEKAVHDAISKMKGWSTEWDAQIPHTLPRRSNKSGDVDGENLAYHMAKTSITIKSGVEDDNDNAWMHGATSKPTPYKIAARNGAGAIESRVTTNIDDLAIEAETGKVNTEKKGNPLGKPKAVTNAEGDKLPDGTVNESGGWGMNAANLATVLRHRHYQTLDHPDGCVTEEKLSPSLDTRIFGNNTVASGDYAHAEGNNTTAGGGASHAEGQETAAVGAGTHAEGNETFAYSAYSHTEGMQNAAGCAIFAVSFNTSPTPSVMLQDVSQVALLKQYIADSNSKFFSVYCDVFDIWGEDRELIDVPLTEIFISAVDEKTGAITVNGTIQYTETICAYNSAIIPDEYNNAIHVEGSYNTANGEGSHAEGIGNRVRGWGAHAEGGGNYADGQFTHAEGFCTVASADTSHAEGWRTKALATVSHAEGELTIASSEASHAEGWSTRAERDAAHAEGYETMASGAYSHAEGNTTQTSGESSHAEGWGSHAEANAAHAEGYETIASGENSHTEGNATQTSGHNSHAEGVRTKAEGNSSHAEGAGTKASGLQAHAEGLDTTAAGSRSHAEGTGTIAKGSSSHAEGTDTVAVGGMSHAEGDLTVAGDNAAHAEGACTKAIASCSHAEGSWTYAYTGESHTEGLYSVGGSEIFEVSADGGTAVLKDKTQIALMQQYIAKGNAEFYHSSCAINDLFGTNRIETGLENIHVTAVNATTGKLTITETINEVSGNSDVIYAYHASISPRRYGEAVHVEGSYSSAKGEAAHAEGIGTIASEMSAHAEGGGTRATGISSHAEGYQTIASTNAAHAEGFMSKASGNSSHAEGSQTIAIGEAAHAEGYRTIAKGDYSHAEGEETQALGEYAHAEGYYTTAVSYLEHVQGRYNKISTISSENYASTANAMIIGNGTSNTVRSNAFRVTFNGNVYGLAAFHSTGADYAEYFEWADGNPDDEDRIGRFTVIDGEKIRLAGKEDSNILGIVSANPAVIGNACEDTYHDMYVTDEWGRVQYESVDIPAQYGQHTQRDAEGNKVTEQVEIQPARCDYIPKINPEYHAEEEYIPRSERKEWDTIGMMGQLLVRDDGSCISGGFCLPADGGIATASENGYYVMARVTANIVKVLLR